MQAIHCILGANIGRKPLFPKWNQLIAHETPGHHNMKGKINLVNAADR